MTSMRVVALFLGAGLAERVRDQNRRVSHREVRQAGEARPRRGRALSSARALPLQEHMQMIRHLSARPVMKESAGAKAESVDPQLAAALRVAAAGPSAENHLRIAQRVSPARDSRHGLHLREPRRCCRSRGSPRRTRCLARIWRDWGFPELGIGPASRATYFAPASAAAENTLGTLLDAIGQPAEARRAFARAVAARRRAPDGR